MARIYKYKNKNGKTTWFVDYLFKGVRYRKNNETKNNINAVARVLQIDPANLRRLIKSYQINIG